jgi:hypothetical protein
MSVAGCAPSMTRLAVVLSVVVAVVAGCKSPCRQLSEKLCDCALNTADKNSCLQAASSQESTNPPSETANTYCKGLLDANTCDCRLTDTPQGKVNCGLARPLDGGI